MHSTDAVSCWRNRQAELEFHIRRHEWFLGKAAVLNPDALQHKIDAYYLEWNTYERLIGKVRTGQPNSTRHAA
jgi:hypothetical protein